MFRRKLYIGNVVLIKKTNMTGTVKAIHYNPYTPWTSISSYEVVTNSGVEFCSRNELKKL